MKRWMAVSSLMLLVVVYARAANDRNYAKRNLAGGNCEHPASRVKRCEKTDGFVLRVRDLG